MHMVAHRDALVPFLATYVLWMLVAVHGLHVLVLQSLLRGLELTCQGLRRVEIYRLSYVLLALARQ